jgi:hypothetical protein
VGMDGSLRSVNLSVRREENQVFQAGIPFPRSFEFVSDHSCRMVHKTSNSVNDGSKTAIGG